MLVFFLTAAPSQAETRHLENLAFDPQWLALLHMHPGLNGTWRTLADDPDFFASSKGDEDPAAEIKILIERKDDPELRCKFVARYSWLSQKIGFAFEPLKECEDFRTWYESINPQGVTLIFPSVFINNPASAFGHTFIRIDQPNKDGLTAYAANYAAATAGENALLYALKGIFGGYQGFFSVAPYYQQVKKYSDLESRDIWEYQLNFTPEETRRVVQHLWELRRIAFDYYYFDENCSFHLLSLFDVARPGLGLVEQFQGYVLPVATLREIAKGRHMVLSARYRPAALTSLRSRLAQSSRQERMVAKEVVEQSDFAALNNLSGESKTKAVELAQDYLSFLAFKGKVSEEHSKSLGYDLLIERSKLESDKLYQEPQAEDPVDGHGILKASVAAGVNEGKGFYELGVRPVYHSLTDPSATHATGSQLELFDFALRQSEFEGLKLQHIDLVDIYSLTTRDGFVRPLSWRLKLASERRDSELVHQFDLGFGRSYGNQSWLTYILAGPQFENSQLFEGDSYQLNQKYEAGVLYNSNGWGGVVSASYQNSIMGNNYEYASLDFSPRLEIDKSSQLRLLLREQYLDDRFVEEGRLLVEFYF